MPVLLGAEAGGLLGLAGLQASFMFREEESVSRKHATAGQCPLASVYLGLQTRERERERDFKMLYIAGKIVQREKTRLVCPEFGPQDPHSRET